MSPARGPGLGLLTSAGQRERHPLGRPPATPIAPQTNPGFFGPTTRTTISTNALTGAERSANIGPSGCGAPHSETPRERGWQQATPPAERKMRGVSTPDRRSQGVPITPRPAETTRINWHL